MMMSEHREGALRILAIEPYYGGSHRAVLDGLVERVDARWTLLTLPPRKWKWRMRGSAIGFATSLAEEYSAAEATVRRPLYDLVFASTFVNLAELYGMAGEALAGVPSIVYFHENQLVYPNRHTAEWDYQFPLTNITTALTADACVFNTEWNMRTFLDEIPGFIRAFPDHRPTGLVDRIAAHSVVIPPPFDPTPFDAVLERGVAANHRDDARVRIVWPHRWEHDKNPEAFFNAVSVLAAEELPFEVAVAGQEFRETSGLLRDAANALGDRLVHVGQPDTRAAYAELLATSDIAVSTAHNEFFGLAMIEASYAGCFPLVPDRLAYPELYPPEFLYADDDALVFRLRELILDRPAPARARAIADRFTFDRCVPSYENLFDTVAR